MMKESRHLALGGKYAPHPADKPQPSSAKSNMGSLKAILNHGRVPLAQYINEKTAKNDQPHSHLTYFDKLKAMFNKGQLRTVREREGVEPGGTMEDEGAVRAQGIDGPVAASLNQYAEDKRIALQKGRPQGPDFRTKQRSMSMNARSRPKYDAPSRLETAASIKARRGKEPIEALERTYNKVHTQAEMPQTSVLKNEAPILIPRFKPVKRETVNYAKFTQLHNSGELESGVIDLEETLGCGANATVRLGRERKSGQTFAVKIYEKYKLVEPSKRRRVFREIQILSKLQHPGVIRMGDCFQDKRQIHILFEFIPNASTLQDFLRGHSHTIPNPLRNQIAVQLTQTIAYLHSNGVSHRDIKTDNVMVGQGGEVKLIDFGFATTVAKGETHCGTPNYMAPQLFTKKGVYSPFQVDVWALGILLYYLYEGCYPFRGYNQKELSRNIAQGVFSLKRCEPAMAEVITSALKTNPNERLSALQLSCLMGKVCHNPLTIF